MDHRYSPGSATASESFLVLLHHLDGVAPDLGLVVLHVAGLEEHRLGLGPVPHQALRLGPLLEGAGGEVRELLVPVDPQQLLHEPSMSRHSIHLVGHAEAGPGQLAGGVGLGQHPLPEGHAPLPGSLSVVAVHQPREVELELVLVPGGVGALHLAELALEAVVHDRLGLGLGQLADVPVVGVVDQPEELGEAVAVLEAHAAAMTDLEGPGDLHLQRRRVPVPGVAGVVAQPLGGLVRDVPATGHGAPFEAS